MSKLFRAWLLFGAHVFFGLAFLSHFAWSGARDGDLGVVFCLVGIGYILQASLDKDG